MKFLSKNSSTTKKSSDESSSFVEGIADMERAPSSTQVRTDASMSSSSVFSRSQHIPAVSSLILFLGIVTSGAFLYMGITAAQQVQVEQFERSAVDLTKKMQVAWDDYVNAAATIHMRCRGRNFTRQDFRDLYEYITDSGLRFQAAQFDPNITDAERPATEEEARQFYATHYPDVEYIGFKGFVTANATEVTVMPKRDYYFPIQYMEPVTGNERAVGLDYHASGSRQDTVMFCIDSGRPALTDRLRLVQELDAISYGVVLMHPGYNLSSQEGVWPRDLASVVVRIPDLIERSAANQGESSDVYLYDKSDSSGATIYLGAASIYPQPSRAQLTSIPEIEFDELKSNNPHAFYSDVQAANKIWTVVVVKQPGTFQPDILFVVIGGSVIFCASIFLSIWVFFNMRRFARYNRERLENEAERTALILASAEESARVERELNDFVAHEVRNPVAAAMAACSFVKTAVNKELPLADAEATDCCREDVNIIENALKFVNDLLRNMLDMHRAASKQIKVDLTPVDLLHDVFEPVQAMLTQRGSQVKIVVDCPKNMWVMSDRLRLKQVVLNLGRNSSKFVETGYIKLTAELVHGEVLLSVADSGPGIPSDKKKQLFRKYQESLDMLSQGTGIGLFLCKNLVDLMGGVLYLDESFESGIDGCPGTRFVVNLKQSLVSPEVSEHFELLQEASRHGGFDDHVADSDEEKGEASEIELPERLRVLFVDDDPILRKLFARTIRTVAPSWDIREVSNGETALQLTDTENFDMIFMDMYMASVEKQMLGTEAVAAMRAKGISCRICGLSANDKEREFFDAGANAFTMKPFPCEARALTKELLRILYDNTYNNVHFTTSIAFADAAPKDHCRKGASTLNDSAIFSEASILS